MSNDEHREKLGRRVREVWILWAREQPNPKPSWLVPWEQLSEPDKEVDRRIGSAIWGDAVAEFASDIADARLNIPRLEEDVQRLKTNCRARTHREKGCFCERCCEDEYQTARKIELVRSQCLTDEQWDVLHEALCAARDDLPRALAESDLRFNSYNTRKAAEKTLQDINGKIKSALGIILTPRQSKEPNEPRIPAHPNPLDGRAD